MSVTANKESNSTTDEPWKEPGQTSQDPSHQKPTRNVVEQEKNKKRGLVKDRPRSHKRSDSSQTNTGGLSGKDGQQDDLTDKRGGTRDSPNVRDETVLKRLKRMGRDQAEQSNKNS